MESRLRIKFEGEQGVDAGGLLREWFLLTSEQLFHPKKGLFSAITEDATHSINPLSAHCLDNHLEYFNFAGRVVARG